MPFGLINVGATFQREMHIYFRGLIGQSMVVYLDDVKMPSKRRSNHLHYLKKIFECCRKYGVSLKPNKSIFVVFEGNLLGHIITKSGITVDTEQMKAITQVLLPNSKKAMQSFLGKINFLH